ncbi:hypothetical protein MMC20_000445 [Loxospora ochrophaea]|nr:hypothetical protein [Loxospora ochrophaea]
MLSDSQSKRLGLKANELPLGFVYVVGVAVFHLDSETSKQQLLVVKRADHEDTFPGSWELPGGHVEAFEIVKDSVGRELLEETGLVVVDILGEFEELYWDSQSKAQKNMQLNYLVTVKDTESVRLNPEEHSDWKWTDEAGVDDLPMTPGMRKVLKDAFTFALIHVPE